MFRKLSLFLIISTIIFIFGCNNSDQINNVSPEYNDEQNLSTEENEEKCELPRAIYRLNGEEFAFVVQDNIFKRVNSGAEYFGWIDSSGNSVWDTHGEYVGDLVGHYVLLPEDSATQRVPMIAPRLEPMTPLIPLRKGDIAAQEMPGWKDALDGY